MFLQGDAFSQKESQSCIRGNVPEICIFFPNSNVYFHEVIRGALFAKGIADVCFLQCRSGFTGVYFPKINSKALFPKALICMLYSLWETIPKGLFSKCTSYVYVL